MTAQTAPDWRPVEVERDRWGRPLVTPPEGGRGVPYTRCTTFVGCLEDTYNLGRWQQRAVAVGLASRPDLLLRVNSLGFEPEDPAEAKRWKQGMGEATEAAMEAAKASASATIGTSLHALTERLDRGQDVGFVPPEYKPHLAAYVAATRAFSPLHIEEFSVHDGLRIGGTADRVVTIDGEPGAFIADLKTGAHGVEYGPGKMAMQLAVYARSVLYDPATGARRPYDAAVSPDRGVIIALNAKTGTCALHWIDLAKGWEAVQLAAQVRAWRAAEKALTTPCEVIDQATGEVLSAPALALPERGLAAQAATDAALLRAIDDAESADELVTLWRAAGPRWTAVHTDRAATRKAALTLTTTP